MNSNTHAYLFRRLAAFLYDCLLLLALFMLLTAVAVRVNGGQAIEHTAYKLALLPIAWFFFAWFWSNGGQTLGMRAWRIKIVDKDGQDPTFIRAFLRAILGPLNLLSPVLLQMFKTAPTALQMLLGSSKIIKVK